MPQLSSSKLITTPSLQFLRDMVSIAEDEIIIVSPWIKVSTLQTIIGETKRDKNIRWKVLTRGKHKDFCDGVSDIDAFELMIKNRAFDLRALKRLHAKVYIVDGTSSLVTSANLTEGGMIFNLEIGISCQDPSEISVLIEEINKWFSDAIPLDTAWLKAEQKKLLAFEKNKSLQSPYYPSPEADEDIAIGKYHELSLPKAWEPLLNSLKETETLDQLNYLTLDDLIPSFIDFFEYLEKIRDGKKHQEALIKWLVYKQTLDTIGDDKTRENVSRKIGNRKNLPENIWNSKDANIFTEKVLSFLNSVIETDELRVSSVLSPTQLQPLGLSYIDLCQFVCGMIENKIIVTEYYAEITPSNQFLIFNKEIRLILKELDHIFRADYQKFMDLEKICQLGDLEKIANAWFYPGFEIFKNLYLTKDGEIGCRTWSLEALMEALAWKLADKCGCYYWHYSQMGTALKYLFPTEFEKTSVHQINARLSNAQDKLQRKIFHHAGSKGYWQLADMGDGCPNNEEAIKSIFREAGTPLHYKEIAKKLIERRRRVNEGAIDALLGREKEIFEKLGSGIFQLRENAG